MTQADRIIYFNIDGSTYQADSISVVGRDNEDLSITVTGMYPAIDQGIKPFEQSRELGREFARTCKKLNAIAIAIGQGFNEEMGLHKTIEGNNKENE